MACVAEAPQTVASPTGTDEQPVATATDHIQEGHAEHLRSGAQEQGCATVLDHEAWCSASRSSR